ncbi:MAG TPA: hypothetical protein VFZ17_00345, partial [Acidimicrobiia bacterium]|nr:hypothetical protein [Acidimicrobiia bacterium]
PATGDDAQAGIAAGAAPVEDQAFVTIPDGSTETFAAGDAGSVTIRRDGATLSIVAVNANGGWAPEVEQAAGVELEVNFENGTTRVDFNAELEDGAVRIRVRVRDDAVVDDPPVVNPAPAPSDDNSGPGSSVDNSGPGNADDRRSDDGDGGDDDSGHGSGGSDDSSSGHGGPGHG